MNKENAMKFLQGLEDLHIYGIYENKFNDGGIIIVQSSKNHTTNTHFFWCKTIEKINTFCRTNGLIYMIREEPFRIEIDESHYTPERDPEDNMRL